MLLMMVLVVVIVAEQQQQQQHITLLRQHETTPHLTGIKAAYAVLCYVVLQVGPCGV